VVWALLATLAWGKCTLADVESSLAALDTALAGDVRAVEPAREAVDRHLKCSRELVSATLAARLHHTWAVLALRTRDHDQAALHLLAAWVAAPMIPRHPLMPTVSEAGDRLLVLQEEIMEDRQVTHLGKLTYVDGHPATWVLDGVPAILQQAGKKPRVLR
jgi:hypothetical protein